MNRKLLYGKMTGVLAVLLVLLMAAGIAEEEKTDATGQWKYVLEGGGAVILKMIGFAPDPDLVIPDELDGYPVTGIGDHALLGSMIRSVIIPDSVVSIGERALAFIDHLENVIIPKNVGNMGGNPFSGCTRLTQIDIAPENHIFTVTDGVLFAEQGEKLVTYPAGRSGSTYAIPQGTLSIGDYAFERSVFLETVIIPDSVESFGDGAFAGCKKFTVVTVPEHVSVMGSNPYAFYPGLTHIDVAPGNRAFAVTNGALVDEREKALVAYPAGRNDDVFAIPEGILRIGGAAFYGCDNLRSVTIPPGVQSIGDRAFMYCTALEGIIIPDGVESIGNRVFGLCSELKTVAIPDSVAMIGEFAFWGTGLKAVIIPGSVTIIGDSAFLGSGLQTVTIPGSVVSIGNRAFCGCSDLSSVTLQEGVESIGEFAFERCGLQCAIIPKSVTSIGRLAFATNHNLTLTVAEGSYAEQYAKEYQIPYIYATE